MNIIKILLILILLLSFGCQNKRESYSWVQIHYGLEGWTNDGKNLIIGKVISENELLPKNLTLETTIKEIRTSYLSLLNLETKRFSPIGSENGNNIEISTKEDKLVFEKNGEIYLINLDGKNQIKISDGFNPKFSPDGTKILYEKNYIYAKNINDFKEEKLSQQDSIIFGDWSPNGEKILYISRVEYSHPRINILDLKTNKETYITEGEKPKWSPDGKEIFFFSFQEKIPMRIKIDEKNPKSFLEEKYLLEDFSFSPDGKNLIFDANLRDGNNDKLFLMNLNNNQVKIINEDKKSFWYSNPVFSPDGKNMACISNIEIIIMSTNDFIKKSSIPIENTYFYEINN